MNSYRFNNQVLHVDDRSLIGSGGEADVYGHGDLALKIYRKPSGQQVAKLRAFPTGLPPEVVTPEGLLRDDAGDVVGYAMARVRGGFTLNRLLRRSWRAGRIDTTAVVELFEKLHAVLEKLHTRDVVVGDLNEGNVLFIPSPKQLDLAVIDADSMQFGAFPCPVGHPRFIPPELYGADLAAVPSFTPGTDWYAFATLLFQSLMYIHPYGGIHPTTHTMEQRARDGLSCLRPEVRLPKVASPREALPADLAATFERIFDDGQRVRFDVGLLALPWTRCQSCGLEHGRPACPACDTGSSLPVVNATASRRSGDVVARRIIHVPAGAIVAASADEGHLRYLAFDGVAMRREDGTVVAQGPPRAGLTVGLAPRTTWLGAGSRLMGLRETGGGRVVEQTNSETFEGETVFGVAGRTLLRMDGDRLIDHARGTVVAPLAAGRTWLQVGRHLGCGFYRAGRLMNWFMFFTDAAGRRPLAMPPLAPGERVLAVSASLGRSRLAVQLETERQGTRRRSLRVFSATGSLLGEWNGDQGPPGGACLVGRAVLLPTDDGLLRLALASHGLHKPVLFEDTEPFVSATDRLLQGPDHTVYVVGDVSITQLRLIGRN